MLTYQRQEEHTLYSGRATASASLIKHLLRSLDDHGNIRMMGKQCDLGRGYRTQGKFLVKVLSSGLRHGAFSASFLILFA
jgi:hypothetical protein